MFKSIKIIIRKELSKEEQDRIDYINIDFNKLKIAFIISYKT